METSTSTPNTPTTNPITTSTSTDDMKKIIDDTIKNVIIVLTKELKLNEGNTIDFQNIVYIITRTMELIESETGLKGLQKKEVALKVVDALINSYAQSALAKEHLKSLIDNVFSNLIDSIVKASKGEFSIATTVSSKCCVII